MKAVKTGESLLYGFQSMRDFWYTMSGNKNMPDLSVWFDSLVMKEKTYSITATL